LRKKSKSFQISMIKKKVPIDIDYSMKNIDFGVNGFNLMSGVSSRFFFFFLAEIIELSLISFLNLV